MKDDKGMPLATQPGEMTEKQGYIGDQEGALERLRVVCEERGISIHTKDSQYIHPVLYWPDLRTVIIFTNATILNIQCVINFLH